MNFSKLVQILILHLILSLHVYFHQNPWKNDEVRGISVLKYSKIKFLPTVQNDFFKISTDSDSPSKAEPSCAYSSKSVKK